MAKEKLDGINVDDIGNLEDLLRFTVHSWKICAEGQELTRNINEKKRPAVLKAFTCPLCKKCFRQE